MTLGHRLVLSCTAWTSLAVAAEAAIPPLSAPIAPQPLEQALAEFAAQTGLQLIYVSTIAASQVAPGAPRGLPASDALTQLLAGTGLQFEFVNERTVRIYSGSAPAIALSTAPTGAPITQSNPQRLAPLEEVVVTSNRREELVGLIPLSTAVWTQEAMEASGATGIAEIAALTPGVEFSFNSRLGDYFTNIVIRGVNDRHGTTTALLLNDTLLVPIRGDSFLLAYPVTFDLDRIEVLRGPQGGRLGQDTLGGAVRFVTNEPSLTNYTGFMRTEMSLTESGEPSYEVGAAAGGPIKPDVVGFRVSGWYRSDGGYVDRVNSFTGVAVDPDANRTSGTSLRAALLWMPTSSLRVTPSLIYQSIGGRDVSAFYTHLSRPGKGELQNGSQTRQPFIDWYYLASLKFEANLNNYALTSVTSYQNRTTSADLDQSPLDVPDPVSAYAVGIQDVFIHEMRLGSVDTAAPLSWIVGVSFSRSSVRDSSGIDEPFSANLTEQTAVSAHGNVALRVTDRWSVTVGARLGRARYESVTRVPPIAGVDDTETWTTPNFGLAYEFDADRLIYLTAAKGYRGGGVYAPVLGCGEVAVPYASDSLWNYEFGTKQSSMLHGRLDFDASAFHIRWTNPRPSPMEGCNGLSYQPVSSAASNGIDFAARLYLNDQTRFGLSVGYADAHYTKTTIVDNVVIIRKGDAISGAPPPWSVTASIEKDFTVLDGLKGSMRADYAYNSTTPTTQFTNLRMLFRWEKLETTIFLDNALDSHPTLGRAHVCCDDPLYTATTFRPRTVGINATWRY
jgi:outer membrane receptor protein involved in Fe transport